MNENKNEIVKPVENGDSYKEAQRVGFALLMGVSEILKEYESYLHYYNDSVDREALKASIRKLKREIPQGYKSLGIEDPGEPELSESNEPMDLNFLLSKITRAASNFFILVMAHPDSWEDNYLNVDLDNLSLYLTIFERQE